MAFASDPTRVIVGRATDRISSNVLVITNAVTAELMQQTKRIGELDLISRIKLHGAPALAIRTTLAKRLRAQLEVVIEDVESTLASLIADEQKRLAWAATQTLPIKAVAVDLLQDEADAFLAIQIEGGDFRYHLRRAADEHARALNNDLRHVMARAHSAVELQTAGAGVIQVRMRSLDRSWSQTVRAFAAAINRQNKESLIRAIVSAIRGV